MSLILLTFIMPVQVSSSLLTSSASLASSGSIVYSFEEPVSLINPENTSSYDSGSVLEIGYALPYTGWGADLALHYNDDMSNWESSGVLPKLEYWADRGMNVSRIEFQFDDYNIRGSSTTYTKTKFDYLLELFYPRGITVIADLHNNGGGSRPESEYVLMQGFIDNWLQMARDYKGDNRIAGFNIFNEAGDLTTMGISAMDQTQIFSDLTRAIHEIDPDRVIFFPVWLTYYSYNPDRLYEWLNDISVTGIINEPNVVFDVLHPYYWENSWDMGQTPEQRAEYYGNILEVCVDRLGSNRVWVGETFAHYPETDFGPATEELQKRYVIAFVNECVRLGVGFDFLACTSKYYKFSMHEDILFASDYPVTS